MIRNNRNPKEIIRARSFCPVRIIIFLLCLMIGLFLCAYKIAESGHAGYIYTEQMTSQTARLRATALSHIHGLNEANQSAAYLQLNSTNAVLLDMESGTILFDKNGTEKMYPASMTKILTAIVALEHISDLNVKIMLNETIFKPVYNADATTAGYLPGEQVRAVDLLYGLLLPSGAECAVGLAEYVAGSESAFVEMMNDKAGEIGMSDSCFTNATGLHDKNHYSTAMDIANLFKYALANDDFYTIISSSRYSAPATNRHSGGITFNSSFFSRIAGSAFDGGQILGGKTGYTSEAGQCLASIAVKNGSKYILVTSGAPGDNQKEKQHIDDAFTVYNAIGSN